MNLQIDWNMLNALNGAQLKKATFKVIQQAAYAVQSDEKDDTKLLETVPRLLDLINLHENDLGHFRSLVSSLARATGLWNYIDVANANIDEVFVAETVTAPELGGIRFHREQINALNSLLSGQNLILSAPTSFGKSILVDALLATNKYKRIAIVLPTIALLDEFRRRFQSRFSEKFDVIMHQSEVSADKPTIFLGTQERLIHRKDLGKLDLTVVDEFYKLDPKSSDERSVTLNAAVYKLLKKSNQFFFLGPNIDNVFISDDTSWKFTFLKTRFSTVAIDTLDLKNVKNKKERLFDEISEDRNWPALVFMSAPGRTNKIAIELSEQMVVSNDGSEFAEWLKHNIGENNFLSQVVEYGFGIHHGRIPRAIAAHMVRLFNQHKLPVILCTSTLIEGVNTAAKTVMIFDKKISYDDYDFFTFSNIKGRAGRLGQHHTGKVMIFNEIPEEINLEVKPIVFGEDNNFPDEYILHIEKPDQSTRSITRFDYYQNQLGLDNDDELRLASSIGLETAILLKNEVDQSLRNNNKLIWSGWPKWPQILMLCEILCRHKKIDNFGAVSPRQLATLIDKLRKSMSMRDFLLSQDESYIGPLEGRDNIFKFLRACEYGLPQYFSIIELFVKKQSEFADYSLFLGGMSCWFMAEILKELDEESIPIQISERFYTKGDTKKTLKEKLYSLCHTQDENLTNFERQWLLDAL